MHWPTHALGWRHPYRFSSAARDRWENGYLIAVTDRVLWSSGCSVEPNPRPRQDRLERRSELGNGASENLADSAPTEVCRALACCLPCLGEQPKYGHPGSLGGSRSERSFPYSRDLVPPSHRPQPRETGRGWVASVSVVATQLLLVRHGQSVWNAEGRWQGQADPPLSDVGRQQAAEASLAVGNLDAIFSSTQQRARQTAEIIAEEVGVGPVHSVSGIEERWVGPWSGMTTAEINEAFPGYLDDGRRPADFESDESLHTRSHTAIAAIAEASPGGVVLIVTHGGVIHNLERTHGLDVGRVPNLGGRVLTVTEADWTIGEPIQLVRTRTGGEAQRL